MCYYHDQMHVSICYCNNNDLIVHMVLIDVRSLLSQWLIEYIFTI